MLFTKRKQNPLQEIVRLVSKGTHSVLGVYNAYSALLAQKSGFKVVYLSGAALSGSLALPDIGIISLEELLFTVRSITRIIQIPLIVDADTGFGEALNVMRTARELEATGAAAIQIEDQEMPKKCGHLEGKRVVDPVAMVQKIRAITRARHNKGFLIIARTDARSTHGLDEAIERANLYLESGADIIFPEALVSRAEFRRFSKEVKAPLLANMTEFGKSPLLSLSQFEQLEYRLVLYPVSLFRIAAYATERAAKLILKGGSQRPLLQEMQTRQEFYRTISYKDYEQLDSSLARDSTMRVQSFRPAGRQRENRVRGR